MFEPATVIKFFTIIWVVMVIGWAGFRLFFRWAWKNGKVTFTFPEKGDEQ